MTIKNLALAAAALCALSCTEFENGFDLTEYKYEQAFVDRFGEIDPNQNWGFGEMPVVRSYISTRAGSVDVETNMWTERESDLTTYKSDRLIQSVKIPGWPNFDGNYYSTTGTTIGTITSDLSSLDNNNKAAGDLTEYEIQKVTEFFQTHNKSELAQYETKLHLTDFFVQNVSRDADRNGDGTPITGASAIGFNLDYLHFKPEGAADFGSGADISSTWTHINEFNAGSTNDFFVEKDGGTGAPTTNVRVIHYVHSSGTEDFACRPSFGTGDANLGAEWIHDWVLVRLTWKENGIDREGYYLAFNYSAEKEGTKIEPDGYYSNWIIKITPAYPNTNTPDDDTDIPVPPVNRRIMCEDLGNTYDFDFNDVVFDVKYETKNDKTEAVVTLQAAGGTLPVYIGVEGNGSVQTKEYEIHERFGVATNVPVNVGTQLNGGKSCPVSIIRFDVSHLTSGKTDPNNIFIRVEGHGLASKEPVVLTGEAGKIPQKICVPTTVGWTKELEDIQDAYPFFNKWVSDATNWTCVLSTADEQEGWTGKISANWYNLNYEYTNWKNTHETGTAPVKKIKISKNSYSNIYYIWHSYRNTEYLYKYDFLPSPTEGQIKDSNAPDDFGESSQEDPNAKYNIYVKSENDEFGTANFIDSNDNIAGIEKSNCEKGSKFRIKAIPNNGYKFVKWNDENTEAVRTITVGSSDCTYTAYFTFDETGYTKVAELDGNNINVLNNQEILKEQEYKVVANVNSKNNSTLKIHQNANEWGNYTGVDYNGLIVFDTSISYSDEQSIQLSLITTGTITVSKLAIYKKNN